jgi:hypothetical protein
LKPRGSIQRRFGPYRPFVHLENLDVIEKMEFLVAFETPDSMLDAHSAPPGWSWHRLTG